jgi:protein TonB
MEFEYNIDENRSFLRRHRALFVVAGFVLLGVGIIFGAIALSRRNQRAIAHNDVVILQLSAMPTPTPPPRPTPPPLSTPPPPPDEHQNRQMIEQQPVQDEKKTDAPKPKSLDAPAPLGTSITGPGGGPDLGLGSGLGGGGGYGGGTGGGGSKYGWYATEVQNRIADAVRNDPRMRRGAMNVIVRIWPDATGRILKATVSRGGNATLESTVQDSILTGLKLPEPPPADMPLPIVMRLQVQQSR